MYPTKTWSYKVPLNAIYHVLPRRNWLSKLYTVQSAKTKIKPSLPILYSKLPLFTLHLKNNRLDDITKPSHLRYTILIKPNPISMHRRRNSHHTRDIDRDLLLIPTNNLITTQNPILTTICITITILQIRVRILMRWQRPPPPRPNSLRNPTLTVSFPIAMLSSPVIRRPRKTEPNNGRSEGAEVEIMAMFTSTCD
ncbi:hypothetical protein N7460_002096 [Penicillium canescens]|uniref:Uncharacterized protein n=1 Tax=Penicillium canescens TaxID=5083 RepID=A0AAD6IJ95_PENCN|nr:hypothetical protein N7460_002096 [Penicillium canescens]